jgi:hypothetical protein
MDTINADIALFVIQYLNVMDSSRLQQTSKRFYYLVQEYRRLRGPQLVAAASDNGNHNHTISISSSTRHRPAGSGPPEKTPPQLYQCALQKLQTKPNLVLAFNTTRSSTLPETLPSLVPRDAVILGAVAPAIQSNVDDGTVECFSNANILLGSMPNAHIKPFIRLATLNDTGRRDILNQLRDAEQPSQDDDESSSSSWWKVFIVYATGNTPIDVVEHFIESLQRQYPRAVIVGGICSMAYVSVPTAGITRHDLQGLTAHELMHWCRCLGDTTTTRFMRKRDWIDHVYGLVQTRPYRLELLEDSHSFDNRGGGIVGIALGGHHPVPVRSVVSRGVQSLTTRTTQPSNCLFVHEASFHQPGDPEYLFQQTRRRRQRNNDNDDDDVVDESESDDDSDDDDDDDNSSRLPSYYKIRSIRDESTGKIWTPNELCRSKGQPEYLGISLAQGDGVAGSGNGRGFELHAPHPLSYNINAFLFFMKSQEQQQQPQQQASSSPSPTSDSIAPLSSSSHCALTNSAVDLFDLSGDACIEDLEWTLHELATTCREQKEEILGAVMYSCSGRGPTASALMRGETMSDATRFARVFNNSNTNCDDADADAAATASQSGTAVGKKATRNVPCLGFYAGGGEIGPLALAGRHCRQTSTQDNTNGANTDAIFQRGGVALQGFTVVFALFVVPVFDLSSSSPAVDDSSDNVHAYFAQCHSEPRA